jgi:Ni/Co efflux regulator RcnB
MSPTASFREADNIVLKAFTPTHVLLVMSSQESKECDMRKLIMAGLMATSLLPVAAQAQYIDRGEAREWRRDREDVREERRDRSEAYRYRDRREIRDERGDLRDARREYRQDHHEANRYDRGRDQGRDWGRNDWRGYRDHNRHIYRGAGWHSNNRYRAFDPGARIGHGYYQPRYQINDYGRYRLPRPGYNQRWVRHYKDVLLIDVRSGYVVNVIRNLYW